MWVYMSPASVPPIPPPPFSDVNFFPVSPLISQDGRSGYPAGRPGTRAETRSTWTLVPLASDGTLGLQALVAAGGSVHVALDVTGYFE